MSDAAQPDRGGTDTATITAVIVCYDEEPQEIRTAIDDLLKQQRAPAEILIVDNSPEGSLAEDLRGHAPQVTAIASGSNLGYTGAVNLAAKRAGGDYLVCLNPDARAETDCLARLAAVADADPSVAVVGAQILLEDGSTCNAGANPLHPTGISPSGGYGQPRETGEPRDVAVVSGACCLIRRATFAELGGFVGEFFLYYDDVDLAWRALIAGMRVVYCPDALVVHRYEFGRRARKWYFLERNRLFSVLTNYEARTLLALGPLLLAAELGVLAIAAYEGWLQEKLGSYRSLFARRRLLLAQRRRVQRSRRRRDVELLALFDDRFDSALLPRRGAALANACSAPYMRLVRRHLR